VPTHQHRRVALAGLTRYVAERPRARGHLARLCIRSAARRRSPSCRNCYARRRWSSTWRSAGGPPWSARRTAPPPRPDETRLVTYCYGPGRGWVRDVPSGELVATLEGIDAYGDVEDRFSRASDRLTVFADDGDALVWDARSGGLLLRVRDLDKSDWHLPRLADDGASLHLHQRSGAVLTLPATRAGTFAAACRALASRARAKARRDVRSAWLKGYV